MELDRPLLPQPCIARLPEILINQIAAGEVVERPASAIKELLENSLDAGATRIDILLHGGGMEEITIVDNGCGMIPEDLLLCIERHATSKICSLEELEAVKSYGFRGEALSSIASVSRLSITSRVSASSAAQLVEVDFGVAGTLRPVGAPVGTRVTVRELFARLPARQKFLRTVGTELSACARMVRELALGAPGVSFFLHHQNRRLAEYVAPTRETRFREGFKAAWTPLHGSESAEGAELAFFLSPADWIQDRGEILLFLNGRTVRNRNLIAAVRNAYLTTLGPHHEPSGVVYLNLRPEWVDVNVHPQKLEVRCLRQEMLYPWILSTVRKTLARTLPPPIQKPETAPSKSSAPSQRAGRFLGVSQGRFLIAEDGTGLLVVDLRLAARRLRLAELQEKAAESSALLVSKLVRLPLDLYPVFEDNADILTQVGFELEPFGNGDVSIKRLPVGVTSEQAEGALVSVLRALTQKCALESAWSALAESTVSDTPVPFAALALYEADPSIGYRLDFAMLEKWFPGPVDFSETKSL